ncbi:unnamed protein product, partial [Tetraodon nigroviridis]
EDMVSQHMLKLYERYNREHRLKEGNTVRSFRANQEPSSHGTVYRLNLTSLQDTEVILSATFHFPLERRPHHKSWSCKRFKSPSCRSLSVHPSPSISLILRSVSFGSEVSPGPMGLLLGNMTFHPQRRGVWQMKDVTQVIKEARNKGHLLMWVELDIGQRKPEEVQPANSLPYLLLYAEDRALAEPNSVAASLQRYDPLGEGGEPELLHHAGSSPDAKGRMRREVSLLSDRIENNELPEVDYRPEGHRKDDLWDSTWHLALKPKHKAEKKDPKRKKQEEVTKLSKATHDEEQVMVKGVGTLTTDGLKHERRSDGKDGKKHKGSTTFQSPVLSFDEQTMRRARRKQWGDGQQRGCSRRNLRVDFADIGWSEWVMAPKAFDAYYCAGTCGFPIPKVVRPSNHATIQSIVRAVGIVSGIPEPCCVPEKMNPLAVLFQDDSKNPVLKIYPNMSIQSCSCR